MTGTLSSGGAIQRQSSACGLALSLHSVTLLGSRRPHQTPGGTVPPFDFDPNRRFADEYRTQYAGLFDHSPKMRAIREMIEATAGTSATVLVRGESGVGKELVARALHAA